VVANCVTLYFIWICDKLFRLAIRYSSSQLLIHGHKMSNVEVSENCGKHNENVNKGYRTLLVLVPLLCINNFQSFISNHILLLLLLFNNVRYLKNCHAYYCINKFVIYLELIFSIHVLLQILIR
jgi:hypothetical protein